MKNPIYGTFINTFITFDVIKISNGLFEALESGSACFVDLPSSTGTFSTSFC